MQDIAAIEKSLHGIAAAFKDGGIFFLIGVGLFLAYKVAIILAKRQRKATQEVNVMVPGNPSGGNGHMPAMIQEHVAAISENKANIVNLNEKLETMRAENRQDHQQIFNAINGLKSA